MRINGAVAMSYKEEEQPQPGIKGDKRVERDFQQSTKEAKRLYVPSFLVLSCWVIFNYSGTLQGKSPQWDYLMFVTVFTFGALVFGFFLLPFVVLWSVVKCWVAPKEQKEAAFNSFAGWVSAWVILILGFNIVPWSAIFP